jgi:hypothetical protein
MRSNCRQTKRIVAEAKRRRWLTLCLALTLTLGAGNPGIANKARAVAAILDIVERTQSDTEPPLHMASFSRPKGREMIGPVGISVDAGRTWKPFISTPDFAAGLPDGYRRDPFPAVLDPRSGRIANIYNALDTPGLDPKIKEPPVALNSYYLRYRVSNDAGRTWLFDEPVIQKGHNEQNPIDGVWKGKNGIYLGDIGCQPTFTSRNELLVPIQICPLGPDGKLTNPGGGYTFHDSAVLIGRWDEKNHLTWDISPRIVGDPSRTTRGMIEPTIAEQRDGRILMILRGSNARGKSHDLPSYKWRSLSNDGGRTWTTPEPWTYTTGESFYSPSSMSQLLAHSSGRVFWIGNITPENANGNLPRYPLVVGEVDPITLNLVKNSILELDTRKPGDVRVDLSHFRAQEDCDTKQIILTVPRALGGYKSKTWTTYRLKVNKP